eukprot:m.1093611 g.1093611  ORF g.1093611 m.1093611 type:complete len:61 (-) comp24298_c0_seq5:298-480(-)
MLPLQSFRLKDVRDTGATTVVVHMPEQPLIQVYSFVRMHLQKLPTSFTAASQIYTYMIYT